MALRKRIAALFEDTSENMLRFFGSWDTHVPHEGEKGGIRERRVKDFLQGCLPGRYGVSSGHIIDKTGEVSLQEDVVVFDRLSSPVLKVDPYYQMFPCEVVLCTVEVKSKLTPKEIEKCIEHEIQLRRLKRSDRGDDLGHIPSFVFAYDLYHSQKEAPPVWARRTFREKANAESPAKPIPSSVLCLRQRFVLRRDIDQTTYLAYEFQSGALMFFLSTLLHRIGMVKTAVPDLFSDYAWMPGIMTEYDENGKAVPIIGIGVGRGGRSTRVKRS